jgi:hypothetical protein
MNKLFVILILFSSPLFVKAHETYFAFAEVEYNMELQVFEGTISIDGHNLEHLQPEIYKEIQKQNLSDSSNVWLTNWLNKHLKLENGMVPVTFRLDGYTLEKNGKLEFYILSQVTLIDLNLTFTFDLFMDEYPSQQNKLTFYYAEKSFVCIFLPLKRSQIIQIKQ